MVSSRHPFFAHHLAHKIKKNHRGLRDDAGSKDVLMVRSNRYWAVPASDIGATGGGGGGLAGTVLAGIAQSNVANAYVIRQFEGDSLSA